MPGAIQYGDPIDRSHPLAKGLVSFWLPLPGRGEGRTLFDLAGRFHGTLTNGPTWAAGPTGFGAVSCDGTDDYVGTGMFVQNVVSTGVSMSWWQKPTTSPTSGTVRPYWFSMNFAGGPEFSSQIHSDNNWYVGYNSAGGDHRVILAASSANAPQNEWSFYTMTCVSGGVSRFYRHGQLLGSNGGTTTFLSPTQPLDFFRQSFTLFTLYAAGLFGGAALHSTALSADATAALYDQARRGFPDLLRRTAGRVYGVVAAGGGGISGTASLTVGSVTAAGTGTLRVSGTAGLTAGNVTLAGAGVVALSGAAAAPVGDVTAAGAGTVRVAGASSITAGDVTASGTAANAIRAAVAVTLDAVGLTAAGTSGGLSGVAALTLGDVTVGAAGEIDLAATAGQTVGDVTAVGLGTVVIAGAVAMAVDGVTAAGTGTVRVAGAVARTLGDVTLAASGGEPGTGTGTDLFFIF